MTTTAKPKKTSAPPMDLVNRCFIQWGDDGHWNLQGVIRGRPTPDRVLVQYFEALMGEPSTMAILPLAEMTGYEWRKPGSYILFEDDEWLRFWIEHKAPKRDSAA